MRILVAGSTGAVGRLMIPKLIAAGHEVIGTTRHSGSVRAIEAMGLRAVVTNALDRGAVMSVVDDVRPEVVIHQLTALSNRDFGQTSRIRIEGTRNLVDASIKFGVTRMIAQSIAFAYEPGSDPASEEVALDLHAPFPRKALIDGIVALEQAVAELREYVVLRYGIFYGPGTWYDKNGFMAEQVRKRQLPASMGVTSFIHVDDAANAATLALRWPTGTVNIVDDEPAQGIDWIPIYADALGAPMPDTRLGREPWERGASNAKARNDYGWKPIHPTWRTGFAETL